MFAKPIEHNYRHTQKLVKFFVKFGRFVYLCCWVVAIHVFMHARPFGSASVFEAEQSIVPLSMGLAYMPTLWKYTSRYEKNWWLSINWRREKFWNRLPHSCDHDDVVAWGITGWVTMIWKIAEVKVKRLSFWLYNEEWVLYLAKASNILIWIPTILPFW